LFITIKNFFLFFCFYFFVEPIFNDYFLVPHKKEYIKNPHAREKKKCILCSIRDRDKDVPSFEVYRGNGFIIVLNLFPYTSGHGLIFPEKHVEKFEELSLEEVIELNRKIRQYMKLLNIVQSPKGYNVGFNEGYDAGGSIRHFHVHVVPRYPRELNFIDVIGKTRVLLEPLEQTLKEMKKYLDVFKEDPFSEK